MSTPRRSPRYHGPYTRAQSLLFSTPGSLRFSPYSSYSSTLDVLPTADTDTEPVRRMLHEFLTAHSDAARSHLQRFQQDPVLLGYLSMSRHLESIHRIAYTALQRPEYTVEELTNSLNRIRVMMYETELLQEVIVNVITLLRINPEWLSPRQTNRVAAESFLSSLRPGNPPAVIPPRPEELERQPPVPIIASQPIQVAAGPALTSWESGRSSSPVSLTPTPAPRDSPVPATDAPTSTLVSSSPDSTEDSMCQEAGLSFDPEDEENSVANQLALMDAVEAYDEAHAEDIRARNEAFVEELEAQFTVADDAPFYSSSLSDAATPDAPSISRSISTTSATTFTSITAIRAPSIERHLLSPDWSAPAGSYASDDLVDDRSPPSDEVLTDEDIIIDNGCD